MCVCKRAQCGIVEMHLAPHKLYNVEFQFCTQYTDTFRSYEASAPLMNFLRQKLAIGRRLRRLRRCRPCRYFETTIRVNIFGKFSLESKNSVAQSVRWKCCRTGYHIPHHIALYACVVYALQQIFIMIIYSHITRILSGV